MTKRRNNTILLLLVLIGLSGCFEFRIPQIGTIVAPTIEAGPYEFFITSQTLPFDSVLAFAGDQLPLDDYRESYPDDPTGKADWFVFRYDLSENFSVDLDIEAEAVSKSFSQSMEMVEIETQTVSLSKPIQLQDIMDLSLVPNGTVIPIPALAIPPDTSYITFPMTRQRFSSGNIDVTLHNDLVCDLGAPISMTFYDSSTASPIFDGNSDTLQLRWSNIVPPGTQATASTSLAGCELPKNVMVITRGYIANNGGGPDMVTVSDAMKTSSFNASGSVSNLQPELVEGYIEAQTLDLSDDISFGQTISEPGLSVDMVYLDTAHVSITISNTSPITGKVFFEFLSLDTSPLAGIQAFSTDSLTIPAEGSQTYTFDLNSASFDLSQDLSYRSYIHTYGQDAEFESSDIFQVDFAFYGKNPGDPIAVKSVDATASDYVFEIDDMAVDGFDLADVIPDGFEGIELYSVELSMDILSTIDIPTTLDLNLIGTKNAGLDSVSISVQQQITGPGSNPHIVITNASELINFMPESIFFGGKIALDGSGNLELAQDLSVDIQIAVPLQFIITDPVSFKLPYFPLDKMNPLPSFLDDFAGSLKAKIHNGWQFGVDLNVYVAHDTTYFNNIAYADCVRTLVELEVAALDTSTQLLVVTKEDYDFLVAAQDSNWLYIDVLLNGTNDGQPSTFVTTDSISLELYIQAEGTLNFNEILPDTTGGAE